MASDSIRLVPATQKNRLIGFLLPRSQHVPGKNYDSVDIRPYLQGGEVGKGILFSAPTLLIPTPPPTPTHTLTAEAVHQCG